MHKNKHRAALALAAGLLFHLAGCGPAAPQKAGPRPTPMAPSNAQQLQGTAAGANPAYLLTIPGKNSKMSEHKCTEKECAGPSLCREPAAGESR